MRSILQKRQKKIKYGNKSETAFDIEGGFFCGKELEMKNREYFIRAPTCVRAEQDIGQVSNQ